MRGETRPALTHKSTRWCKYCGGKHPGGYDECRLLPAREDPPTYARPAIVDRLREKYDATD